MSEGGGCPFLWEVLVMTRKLILFLSIFITCFSPQVMSSYGRRILGYFPFYSSYRENFSFSEPDTCQFTHLNYQSSAISSDGSLEPADTFVDIVKARKTGLGTTLYEGNYGAVKWLKKKNPTLKVMLSVGGVLKITQIYPDLSKKVNSFLLPY